MKSGTATRKSNQKPQLLSAGLVRRQTIRRERKFTATSARSLQLNLGC